LVGDDLRSHPANWLPGLRAGSATHAVMK